VYHPHFYGNKLIAYAHFPLHMIYYIICRRRSKLSRDSVAHSDRYRLWINKRIFVGRESRPVQNLYSNIFKIPPKSADIIWMLYMCLRYIGWSRCAVWRSVVCAFIDRSRRSCSNPNSSVPNFHTLRSLYLHFCLFVGWSHARHSQSHACLILTLWRLLLPYGHSYKASCARPG